MRKEMSPGFVEQIDNNKLCNLVNKAWEIHAKNIGMENPKYANKTDAAKATSEALEQVGIEHDNPVWADYYGRIMEALREGTRVGSPEPACGDLQNDGKKLGQDKPEPKQTQKNQTELF